MGAIIEAEGPLNRLQSISETLVTARKAATALPGFPGPLPTSFNDAYAVQNLSREAWPDKVAGWKVGGVPSAFVQQFQQEWLVGPIFSRNVVFAKHAKRSEMPVFAGGFAAIEPEFILEIGNDRLQDRLFIGAEIASSPLPAINDIGPIAVICDFGNNRGMLLGPEVLDWQADGTDPVTVATWINGEEVASKSSTDFAGAARASRDFLLNHAAQHEIQVPAGTFISTGAITGVHEAEIGAQSTLHFGRFGSLDLVLTTAQAGD